MFMSIESESKVSLKYLEPNYMSSQKSFFLGHNTTSVWIAKSSYLLCGRINSVSSLVAGSKKKYGLYTLLKQKVISIK